MNKSLLDSALLIFGITIAAYAINITYELTRLLGYGVSPDLAQVKVQNFLILGFIIGFLIVVVTYSQRSLFKVIEKVVKSETAANHTKEEVLQIFVCGMIGMILLFSSALLRFLGQDPFVFQSMKWAALIWALGMIVAIGRITWFLVKAKMNKSSYSRTVDEHYRRINFRPTGQSSLNIVYVAAIILSIVLVPMAGFSASSATHDMFVIKTDDETTQKVIIGAYGDDYIVKDYDTKAGRYHEAYSLVEMRDKKVEFVKNGF